MIFIPLTFFSIITVLILSAIKGLVIRFKFMYSNCIGLGLSVVYAAQIIKTFEKQIVIRDFKLYDKKQKNNNNSN